MRPKQCGICLVQVAPAIVGCDCVQHRTDGAAKLFRQVRRGALQPNDVDANANVGKRGCGGIVGALGAEGETRDDKAEPIQHERSEHVEGRRTSVGGDVCDFDAVTPQQSPCCPFGADRAEDADDDRGGGEADDGGHRTIDIGREVGVVAAGKRELGGGDEGDGTACPRGRRHPVWWSPPHFRRRLPTWPKPARLTRLNFVDKWSNWSAPAAIRMISRGSSNQPRSRSATGSTVADRRDGRREEKVEVVTPTERDELIRLRRENKQLRQERDILSRAAAWFARETGAVPSGSSNS